MNRPILAHDVIATLEPFQGQPVILRVCSHGLISQAEAEQLREFLMGKWPGVRWELDEVDCS